MRALPAGFFCAQILQFLSFVLLFYVSFIRPLFLSLSAGISLTVTDRRPCLVLHQHQVRARREVIVNPTHKDITALAPMSFCEEKLVLFSFVLSTGISKNIIHI